MPTPSTLPPKASAAEIATWLGASRTCIHRHLRRANMISTNGKYDTRAVLSAIREHRQEDNRRAPAPGSAKDAKLRLEARLLELRVAEAEGRLVPTAGVEAAWTRLVLSFRARMLSLPKKVAPRVCGVSAAEAEEVLTQGIHEALEALAHDKPRKRRTTAAKKGKTDARPKPPA